MCEPCLGRFVYDPLDDNSGAFRLLVLAPGAWDAPLDCNLIEDSREASTFPYEALSYTWGDSSALHNITLNNALFSVTTNLYLALRNLRQADVERILWVDAICINQISPIEKTQQVSQMRNIYQAAERVVVWLGEGCVETHRAISWVSSHFERDEQGLEHLTKTARTIMDGCPKSTVDDGDDGLDGEETTQDRRLQLLKGFNNLLSRPWWSRVWVIQEVVVNSDVTIMCGHSEVSWTTFMAFVEGIYKSKPLLQASLEESTKYRQSIEKALSQQQFASQASQKMSDLLLQHRGLSASDPRDNAYALLGLASDMATSKFLPDYSKSTDEVYKGLTREIVKRHNNLTIICASQPSATLRSTLPSWTPDWSSPWMYFCLARAPYSACSNSTADVTFSKDLSRMNATGLYLATIENVSATYESSGPTFIDWLERVRGWRTLIGDWDTDSRAFEFDNFLQIYSRHVMGSEPAYPVDLSAYTPKQAKKSSKKDVMKFQTHMNSMCWNRKLAATKLYGSLPEELRLANAVAGEGLVPANAVAGDKIVLLHGCRVPIVLRRSGAEEWNLVGDAYLAGYMHGQAFNGFLSYNNVEVFSIR
jgi:hypothetical protein